MAEVTVILFSYLADLIGGSSQVQCQGSTVGEVLRGLGDTYPSLSRKLLDARSGVVAGVTVYRNDVEVALPEGLNAPVDDGDRLRLLPVVAGG
jgi:molybdopterin converting factor small subunit